MTLHLAPPMTSRAAVLVVEDETSLRTTMCATLTLMGFMTHQADSVEQRSRFLVPNTSMRLCSMFAFPIRQDCSSPAFIYCGS